MLQQLAVFGLIAPLITALVLSWFGPRLVSALQFERGEGGAWPAFGAAAGYVAGQMGMLGLKHDVTDRIPWLVLAATVFAIFETFASSRLSVRLLGRVILAALTVGLMLGPLLPETTSTRAGILWLGVISAVILASWLNLDALAREDRRAPVRLVLPIMAAGIGIVLLASGSLDLGRLGLALAAALTGAVATRAAWAVPTRGLVMVASAVLAALILEGHVYASLPTASALLLAASPLGLWVGQIAPVRRLPAWHRLLFSLVPALLVIGLALGASLAASSGGDGY